MSGCTAIALEIAARNIGAIEAGLLLVLGIIFGALLARR